MKGKLITLVSIITVLHSGVALGQMNSVTQTKSKIGFVDKAPLEKPPENKVTLSAQRNRATQGENLPIVGEKSSQLSYVGILLIFGIFLTVILAPKYKRE